MSDIARYQDQVLRDRITRPRQLALITGPRQVGKTTPCRALASKYLDWNRLQDRQFILRGPEAVATQLGLRRGRESDAVVVFDNLRDYRRWDWFLRGFRAMCGARTRVIVTGSTAVELGRGSLAAASFRLRLHPLSVAECAGARDAHAAVQPPLAIADAEWNALREHGGFPEPFLKRNARFTRRWHSERENELVQRDLRQLANLRELAAAQLLPRLLSRLSGSPLIYSQLSRELGVAVDTVRRWIALLVRMQYGFSVRPWANNVAKALRKEPKWFLRDWSAISAGEARERTFVACHLLKAVEGWSDRGLGRFELRYVRDKLRREVDFLVVRDGRPWFLVDVGSSPAAHPSLGYFQHCTHARHAFHVVPEAPFVAVDCFTRTDPVVVSARTLLSQLL